MARNRFGKDYRLIETFDQKGRVRTTYEYIGDSYVFCSEAETVGRVKRHAPVRCLCGWLFWIAALSLPSGAGRKLYAVLPLAFSAVPLVFLTEYAVTLRKLKEPLEHRHADMLENRYPTAAMFLSILAFFSFAGETAGLLTGGGFSAGDALFLAGSAGLFFAGVLSLRARSQISVQKRAL